MASPHQIRQAGALAFRNRQRGHVAGSLRPVRSAPAPSVQEQLCAAAHRILSDGLAHQPQAQAWAVRYLAQCAPGRELTTFIRAAMRRAGPLVRWAPMEASDGSAI